MLPEVNESARLMSSVTRRGRFLRIESHALSS